MENPENTENLIQCLTYLISQTMIAELEHPLETLRGNLTKEHYARVQYGKVVIQRRPKRDKPPT